MQDAALEHALLATSETGRYVTYAGRLEPLRRDADGESGLFAPLLASSLLVAGERSHGAAWTPSLDSDADRVEGAILAYRRFDITLDRAARLAGRSREDFATLVADSGDE
jgi:hypothetical protein